MKAILVIEMPSSCRDCDLSMVGSVNFCGKTHKKIEQNMISDNKKPEWCPLKPMIEKKEKATKSESVACFNLGYNACIDEILGDKE